MKRLIVPLLWRLGLLIPLLALTWLKGLDCIGRQLLFQIRGPRPMSDRVRLLAIDEASIDPALSDFGPWPWPRALQAELAAQVLEQGAQRVVFNIVYPGESSYGPEDDAAFLFLVFFSTFFDIELLLNVTLLRCCSSSTSSSPSPPSSSSC